VAVLPSRVIVAATAICSCGGGTTDAPTAGGRPRSQRPRPGESLPRRWRPSTARRHPCQIPRRRRSRTGVRSARGGGQGAERDGGFTLYATREFHRRAALQIGGDQAQRTGTVQLAAPLAAAVAPHPAARRSARRISPHSCRSTHRSLAALVSRSRRRRARRRLCARALTPDGARHVRLGEFVDGVSRSALRGTRHVATSRSTVLIA